MTLEENIKTKMDEYYLNKNAGSATPIFEDGAKWMLSELKPVMEEMKEVILLAQPYIKNMNNEMILERIDSALSKYNELFKK